jgi:thioredoxin 1
MAQEITTATFDKEVSKASQTVLVDFWASWCGPCRMQGPILDAFALENSDIKVVKCNVDENPELAEKFNIMSIPSLLVFKNGKLVKSAVGLHDKQALTEMVK